MEAIIIILVFLLGICVGGIIGLIMSSQISKEYTLGINDTFENYFKSMNSIQKDYFSNVLESQNKYFEKAVTNLAKAVDELNKNNEAPIWREVSKEIPECEGLYYGKKDESNSMWKVVYKNGDWYLSGYPNHKIEVIKWTEIY